MRKIKDFFGFWSDKDEVDGSRIYCAFGFWLRLAGPQETRRYKKDFNFNNFRLFSWGKQCQTSPTKPSTTVKPLNSGQSK